MTELLGRNDARVTRVLEALKDDEALRAQVHESQKEVFWLVANVVGVQLDVTGPVVKGVLAAIKAGAMNAVIIQTAMSGVTPSRDIYGGAADIARDCCKYSVPLFSVRTAPYPLRYDGYPTFLDEVGGVTLQNAFSEEGDRVVRVVHGALNADPDPLVVVSSVHAYFEQTEWPPEGWGYQPGGLVRGSCL